MELESHEPDHSTHQETQDSPEFVLPRVPRDTETVVVSVVQGISNLHDDEFEDEDSAEEPSMIPLETHDDEDKYKQDRESAQRFSIRQHWWIMVSLALLDTISGTLAILPILYLPSIVLLLFGQLTLPLNMLLSRFILQYQYVNLHYYGAVVVLLGVLVASYADATNPKNSFNYDMMIFWSLLLLIVKFLGAGASIYRERMLKKYNLKAWHTTVWVSLFQSLFSLLLLPVVLIPFPAPWIPIQVGDLELYIRNAFHCLFGQSLEGLVTAPSLVLNGTTHEISSEMTNLCVGDNNWILFCIFLLFNIIYNVLDILLTKLMSSNYAITMAVLRIGLSAFLFTQKWLAGPAYHEILFLQVIGFFVILLGILVYKNQPFQEPPANKPKDITTADGTVVKPSKQKKKHRILLDEDELQ